MVEAVVTENIKSVVFSSAGAFLGSAVGLPLGAKIGFDAGLHAGHYTATFLDPQSQALPFFTMPLGAAIGTAVGATLGVYTGTIAGGASGMALSNVTTGIYNAVNSYAFQPIINATSSVAGSISITEAARVAYENAGALAKSAGAVLSENQLLIGAAATAAVVGIGGYKIYEHLKAEQEDFKFQNDPLLKEQEHLNKQFQKLSLIISDASTKTQNAELKALHEQFVQQYFGKEDKIVETIHNLTLKYNEVMPQLLEPKLKEVIDLGSDIYRSIAKCQKLEKAVGKHSADVLDSRHAANSSDKARV